MKTGVFESICEKNRVFAKKIADNNVRFGRVAKKSVKKRTIFVKNYCILHVFLI